LVQAVDVLRENRGRPARAFEVDERAVRGVRRGLPARMVQPRLPGLLAYLAAGQVLGAVKATITALDAVMVAFTALIS
jgi:hypothetical protein